MMNADQVQRVDAWLLEHAAMPNKETGLRAAFPDLHFTFCDDADVLSDDAFLASAGFNLYLIDASSHCLQLTVDLAVASGLVVASREEN